MSTTETRDAIVDGVRRVRREVSEQYGHDLDQLFEHLRQVEREYAERKGMFAGVTPEAAARVAASWGDVSAPVADPMIDAVRESRRKSAG